MADRPHEEFVQAMRDLADMGGGVLQIDDEHCSVRALNSSRFSDLNVQDPRRLGSYARLMCGLSLTGPDEPAVAAMRTLGGSPVSLVACAEAGVVSVTLRRG
jgi:hypothetical protein